MDKQAPNFNFHSSLDRSAVGQAIDFLERHGWEVTVFLPGKMIQFEHPSRLHILQIWFYLNGTTYHLANFNTRQVVLVHV